jgi:AmmeMemoRadiSam system protein B
LVAPHLDYVRGEPCYVAAYGALRGRPAPTRVVILGTNHFGRSPSVVATVSSFSTPLGTTRPDVAFLEALEKQCGNLRTYELDHLREHSIELQVTWLQYLFGAGSFEIVPFLCPDPCGPTGTLPSDGQGVDLADFARMLGDLVAAKDGDTLIVAGADLTHVGAAFGDERELDDTFLEEVRQRDVSLLDSLSMSDPASFLRSAAQNGNATRVCSAGCVFVLATALPQTTGTLLRYHQAVDQPSQTCVTCAAIVFA